LTMWHFAFASADGQAYQNNIRGTSTNREGHGDELIFNLLQPFPKSI
jgi:hypothetical protein